MAYQGVTNARGEIKELATLPGTALIGTKIHAPLSVNNEVWVLPMEGVLANKVRVNGWVSFDIILNELIGHWRCYFSPI
jgi:hypothetical protein